MIEVKKGGEPAWRITLYNMVRKIDIYDIPLRSHFLSDDNNPSL